MPWRGPEEPGEFPTLGYLVIDWIEQNLVFSDGPMLGEPFRLYDEQAMHFLHKYRLDPEAPDDAGNDAFVNGGSMIVRGQKWGKDPMLAAEALFHAFGPCVFAGYDEDGEPVGKPHPSPWVAVAALNDKQTDNTWIPLVEMAKASPTIPDIDGVEIFDHFINLPCGNQIIPVPTTAWGRLGGRFTFVTLTENGLLTGSGERGGLAFARTLKRSVSGMNGMWTAATNTWDPTEKSDAQLIYEAKPDGVYIDAKMSRKHVDLDNDEELEAELLYLYGDSAKENGGHVSIKRLMRDCRDKSAGDAEVRRFFLSEVIAGTKPLATPERWAALHRPDEVLRPGEAITLGFDGSRSRDATVITAVRLSDKTVFHLRTWVPAECPDRRIPRAEVDLAMRDAFTAYDVKFLFADPFKWQDYLDIWAGLWPKRVVEVATNEERRIDKIVERFTNAIHTGELGHGGENADALTEHIRNTALKKGKRKPPRQGADGTLVEHYLSPVKKREGVLIDAAISAMLAYAAAGQAIEEGALSQKKSKGFNVW